MPDAAFFASQSDRLHERLLRGCWPEPPPPAPGDLRDTDARPLPLERPSPAEQRQVGGDRWARGVPR